MFDFLVILYLKLSRGNIPEGFSTVLYILYLVAFNLSKSKYRISKHQQRFHRHYKKKSVFFSAKNSDNIFSYCFKCIFLLIRTSTIQALFDIFIYFICGFTGNQLLRNILFNCFVFTAASVFRIVIMVFVCSIMVKKVSIDTSV